MSDFNDFNDDDDNDVVEVPQTVAAADPELAFAALNNAGIDPNLFIVLQPMGSDPRYVPAAGPMIVGDVFGQANIAVTGNFKFYVNGTEVAMTDTVPAGTVVSLVGASVKGGAL